jgi:hypothetical protein
MVSECDSPTHVVRLTGVMMMMMVVVVVVVLVTNS